MRYCIKFGVINFRNLYHHRYSVKLCIGMFELLREFDLKKIDLSFLRLIPWVSQKIRLNGKKTRQYHSNSLNNLTNLIDFTFLECVDCSYEVNE